MQYFHFTLLYLVEDGPYFYLDWKWIIFEALVKCDLPRKARLVADGHRHKDVPLHLAYSYVASRQSVRMGFLLATLNDLDIMACDIGNAYITPWIVKKFM